MQILLENLWGMAAILSGRIMRMTVVEQMASSDTTNENVLVVLKMVVCALSAGK
jgi:hypothetical protein